MSFIDSKPVVLRKTLTVAEQKKRGNTVAEKVFNAGTNKPASAINAKKVESEDFKPLTVTSDLATQIANARNAKGLKQADLAKLINVTPSLITAYEKKGSNVVVDLNVLNKISKALSIVPPLKKPKVPKMPKVDLDAH
jgi:ribosome-binding protein aMBF1 (putative translation factor)